MVRTHLRPTRQNADLVIISPDRRAINVLLAVRSSWPSALWAHWIMPLIESANHIGGGGSSGIGGGCGSPNAASAADMAP